MRDSPSLGLETQLGPLVPKKLSPYHANLESPLAALSREALGRPEAEVHCIVSIRRTFGYSPSCLGNKLTAGIFSTGKMGPGYP